MKPLIGCLLISVIWGCSTIDKSLPDYRHDYKESKPTQPLEVPPNLLDSTLTEEQMILPADPEVTSFSDYEQNDSTDDDIADVQVDAEQVLPTSQTVQIKRKENVRWLVFNDEPAVVWSKVKKFWLESGFKLKIDDPTIGIMETEWKENRADIPQDTIREYFGKFIDTFYSASTRDKFRIRLEQVSDTTEVYLTHKGVEEIERGEVLIWQTRPTDSELEIEMLKRILVFTGVELKPTKTLLAAENKGVKAVETVVESVQVAKLVTGTNGKVSLVIQENFAQAWRRVGLALDRLGFTVEDRDRSNGVYFIRYIATKIDKGFFAGWFGDSKTDNEMEYLINLLDEPTMSRVIVLDSNNQLLSDETSKRILTLLHESIVNQQQI